MATLYSGLGGPAGYGESYFRNSSYTGNLDDGYAQVNVTSIFGPAGINVNGTSYSSLCISTNGLVTFNSGVTAYTPGALTALVIGGFLVMLSAAWRPIRARVLAVLPARLTLRLPVASV